MAQKRINTRSRTKEKPYTIKSYFFFKIGKAEKSKGWAKYVYFCKIRADKIFVYFPGD